MLNHVVPREEIEKFTLELVEKIAEKPLFALKMTKRAVNQILDTMGQQTALDAVFDLHQICHLHNEKIYGSPVDPRGFPQRVKK